MKKDDLLEEARDRFALVSDMEDSLRDQMQDDYDFEAGEQWPDRVKQMRERDPDGPRPCLTVNLVKKHVQSLVNDIRRNRPSMKVLAVDDRADPDTAEIINGLYRHIQAVSDADIAYDHAAWNAVVGGVGYWRIGTEVVNEERNEQEIRISQIRNPFSVYLDPYAEHPAGADAEWGFVTEEMSRKKFKLLYPDSDAGEWQGGGDDDLTLWFPDDNTIRIAEYYVVKEVAPEQEEPGMPAGEPGETDAYMPDVSTASWTKSKRCFWYKLAGNEILEERELSTSYVPIVRVIGEERTLDGRKDYRGLVRDLKDSARMYNYWSSANTELVALSPKSPYLAPAEAIEGHEDDWGEANTSNKPYLLYNQFDQENGERLDPPSRSMPVQVNTGIVQSMLQAAEDMRQISGQSQAAFGEKSNENSGRAINARRAEQDNNTFHFVDELSRAIKHGGRIVLEMIPHIYDTRRVLRILGEDESVDFVTVDPMLPRAKVEEVDALGRVQRIYNPSIGRYDVRVTVGPSYASRQEEAAERLTAIIQSAPDMMSIAGDLLFKSMDIPGADDLAERMKALLPPQIQQLEEAKKSGQEQGMQQAEMVRQQMIAEIGPMIEELKSALDQAAQENAQLEQTVVEMKLQLDNKQGELQLRAAELQQKAEEAQMKNQAEMADAEAEVAVEYIRAQAGMREEQNEQPERQPEQESSAAQAAQIALQVVTQLTEQLTQRVEALAQNSQGAIDSLQQAHSQIEQQSLEIAKRVQEQEAQRERMADIAASLLSGQITDEQAANAIRGRLN